MYEATLFLETKGHPIPEQMKAFLLTLANRLIIDNIPIAEFKNSGASIHGLMENTGRVLMVGTFSGVLIDVGLTIDGRHSECRFLARPVYASAVAEGEFVIHDIPGISYKWGPTVGRQPKEEYVN